MRPTHPLHSRPMLSPVSGLVLLTGLLLLLAACTGGTTGTAAVGSPSAAASAAESMATESMAASDAQPEGETVTISGTSFGTDELTVAVGDTVTFVNGSGFPHTVTEGSDGNAVDDARFNEDLPAGESVEVTFEEAGDYDVTCLFHGNMNMVVHVE